MRIKRKFCSGLLLQITGLVMIAAAMGLAQLPLLLNSGPQGWIQFLVAMLGYLLLLSGIFLDQWIKSKEEKINVWRRALISLLVGGGLYLFMMAFATSSVSTFFGSKLDYALIMGGSGCLVLGLIIRFIPAVGRFLDKHRLEPFFVKGGLILWMGIMLAVFLLYWGAPWGFWSFVKRLGLSGYLLKLHDSLTHFFMYY